jgi:hypothetical protein
LISTDLLDIVHLFQIIKKLMFWKWSVFLYVRRVKSYSVGPELELFSMQGFIHLMVREIEPVSKKEMV